MPLPETAHLTGKIAGERRADRPKIRAFKEKVSKLKLQTAIGSRYRFYHEVLQALDEDFASINPDCVAEALNRHPAEVNVLHNFIDTINKSAKEQSAHDGTQPARADGVSVPEAEGAAASPAAEQAEGERNDDPSPPAREPSAR